MSYQELTYRLSKKLTDNRVKVLAAIEDGSLKQPSYKASQLRKVIREEPAPAEQPKKRKRHGRAKEKL